MLNTAGKSGVDMMIILHDLAPSAITSVDFTL